ncbi:MAG: hypothetical protein ACO3JL_17220, partial [Myxococcota bacterium]
MSSSFVALGALWMAIAVVPAWAGEELSVEQLVRTTDAVALIERSLMDGAEVRVVEWWRGGGKTSPAQEWSSLCIPDRATLQAWQERLPQHPGQSLWRQLLGEPSYRSVVFFVMRDGVLRPRCETEAMRGLQVTVHPQHGAWRETLEAALVAAPATLESSAAKTRAPIRGPALHA